MKRKYFDKYLSTVLCSPLPSHEHPQQSRSPLPLPARSGTRLLCHQRDFTDYFVDSDYMKLGYIIKPIVLKKGCLIGMESFVMPGVTVGEGAIVGAGSLVTKDIPAWTIAVGRPAKVVKAIPHRKEMEE